MLDVKHGLPITWFSDGNCVTGENGDPLGLTADSEISKKVAAQTICKSCPVKLICLGFGLELDKEYFPNNVVYGGKLRSERDTLNTNYQQIALASLYEYYKNQSMH